MNATVGALSAPEGEFVKVCYGRTDGQATFVKVCYGRTDGQAELVKVSYGRTDGQAEVCAGVLSAPEGCYGRRAKRKGSEIRGK